MGARRGARRRPRLPVLVARPARRRDRGRASRARAHPHAAGRRGAGRARAPRAMVRTAVVGRARARCARGHAPRSTATPRCSSSVCGRALRADRGVDAERGVHVPARRSAPTPGGTASAAFTARTPRLDRPRWRARCRCARARGGLFLRRRGPARGAGHGRARARRRRPARHTVAHKGFTFSPTGQDGAAILVERDLDDDERGPFHQRRLRAVTAAAGPRPLRDAVVYASFGGRQYSDNPRAIHEELVRRGLPLEHLWVVRDGAFAVPDGAGALRKSSREYHEALATARYIVTNDVMPGGSDAPTARSSSRRCTATRSAARASTSPRSAARRGGCSRGSTSRSRAGRTCSPRRALDGVPARRVRARGRAAGDGPPAHRRARGRGARGAAHGGAGRARPARRRTGHPLRADLPGGGGGPPRPLPARPARRPRPACATPPGPTQSCSSASTRSSPTPRPRRASGCSTSRSSRRHGAAHGRRRADHRLLLDARGLRADRAPLLCFGYDLEEYAETVRGFYCPSRRPSRRRCCGPRTSSPRRSPTRWRRARPTPGAATRSSPTSARSTTAARPRASRTGVLLDSSRVAVHFVHIGKTGGTAIKHVLRPVFRAETETALGKVILHKGHTFSSPTCRAATRRSSASATRSRST